MLDHPLVQQCPECSGELEVGFLQAQGAGIMWTTDPDLKWTWIFSKKWVKLQKNWFGFPKLTKEKLPAARCQECKLVLFRYSAE